MKFVCIVAEYNPLHLGHVYHIAQSADRGDAVVVVMGGDFCQRGLSTVLDKYTRAAHAVKAGADVVVELPTLCTVNCAEQFAQGALRLVHALPEAVLSFGSECGDLAMLETTADCLADESVNARVHSLVDQGVAYPKARQTALDDYARRHNISVADVGLPNNILALEYIKANRGKCGMFTTRRTQNYHSDTPALSSAYIRQAMQEGGDYTTLIPDYVKNDLHSATPEQTVLYLAALRRHDKPYYEGLLDATEGLQNRVWQSANACNTLTEALENACTKRYTRARITRLFTAALLDLRQSDLEVLQRAAPYFNVLAVRKDKLSILSALSQCGTILTSHAALSAHPMGQIDAKAHDIYRLLHAQDVPHTMQII